MHRICFLSLFVTAVLVRSIAAGDEGGACAGILPNVRQHANRYLARLEGREFHVRQRWETTWHVPQRRGTTVENDSVVENDFWVCFRLRHQQLRIVKEHRDSGERHVFLLNARYAASLRSIAGHQFIVTQVRATPRWTGPYPDFYATGLPPGRPEDAPLAVLAPVVANGLPVAVALEDTDAFSISCRRTPDGLVAIRCVTKVERPQFFAWRDSWRQILLDPKQAYAVVRSRTVYSNSAEVITEVTYSAARAAEPVSYRWEQTVTTLVDGRKRVLQHDVIDNMILESRPCCHPAEAFYLPYYGIDESSIEQTSSGRVIALAAGSVTALLIALLALLALRCVTHRASSEG